MIIRAHQPTIALLILQRRTFHSFQAVWRQKSLVDKIRAAPGSRNDLSFSQSFSFYWEWLITPSKKLLKHYEDRIVETIPLPAGVKLERSTVAGLHEFHLSNDNVVESNASTNIIETPTLLVHGHAASGVLYHRNFSALSSGIRDLYTIDFPDTGLSDKRPLLGLSLPKQKLELIKKKRTKDDTSEAEITYKLTQDKEKNWERVEKVQNYYVDALEKWRLEKGFESINLVSHSFGALMSFQYALRYPNRVNKLVLCSPAGVERSIFSLNNTEQSGKISDDPSSPSYYRPPFIPKFFAALGLNITKSMGPLGVLLISKYLSMRYSRGITQSSGDDEQVKLLVKYTIALFHQRNNSYKNLQTVLNNQLLAYNPILDHANQLKVSTAIMYGSYDWMNSQAGYQMYKEIESTNHTNNDIRFSVINNAGHNVFLDNHEEYDKQVLAFLRAL